MAAFFIGAGLWAYARSAGGAGQMSKGQQMLVTGMIGIALIAGGAKLAGIFWAAGQQ